MHCGMNLASETGIAVDSNGADMNYHKFWKSLRAHPSFQRKPVPGSSSAAAWGVALYDGHKTARGVVQFSASVEVQ